MPEIDAQVPWVAMSFSSQPENEAAREPPLRRECPENLSAYGHPSEERRPLTTSVNWFGVKGCPEPKVKAGEKGVPGTVLMYVAQAVVGHAGEPGMCGSVKTTGVEPAVIVLEEVSLTNRPELVIKMSLRVKVWGPDQREADGVNKFEALKKAKKPIAKAALMVAPSVTQFNNSHTLTRS